MSENFHVEIAVLRKEVKLRFEAQEKALKLQAAEYSRRLDTLNGEAERLRIMQESYFPRELAEAKFMVFAKQLDDLRIERSKDVGRLSTFAAVVAVVVSLVIGWVLK